jgi:acid phosphatase family membrane protein YuiD
MNLWNELTSNHIINVGVAAWFCAQLLKTIFTYIGTRKIVLERLVGAGGMPSSHSALTCSIAVAMSQLRGFSSPEFGLALMFAAIVIYDAMGVRRAAGEQAKVLNRMVFEFPWDIKPKASENKDDEDESAKPLLSKELKESLGHTPFEVLGGCLLGILVALFMPPAV